MLRTDPRKKKTGKWTEAALRVLQERYLWRKANGKSESPEDMLWRVATTVAAVERKWGVSEAACHALATEFYALMVDGVFLPNSPTLMNAGKANGLQYSACYVLPVEDTLEGIFDAVKKAALIHKSGGGTGFSFSRLRAKNSPLRSTGGKAGGPVSFLRVFNAATEAVKQGGTRRGANMGMLACDHPDVEEFIECKMDGGIANFNISVAATDAFMEAVQADAEYCLRDTEGQPVRSVPARQIFERIVHAAWRTGDPGLVFIDRVNRSAANPIPQLSRIEATNPCGEQPLAPNEACNLGSINLSRFLLEKPIEEGAAGRINWEKLEHVVRTCVRLLDDVIECNPYPLPEIDDMVKSNRRIGLGVMGWADLLIALALPYQSEEALQLAERLMGFINRCGHQASELLAEERGAFPNWERSIYASDRRLRNATITTVAPTGTISIMAGCSSGIEPLFALAYSHVVGERHLTFINAAFEKIARDQGFYSADLMRAVSETGTLEGRADVPQSWAQVLTTAHQVSAEWHVRMQAAFQRHTDNGVSKTVNLPSWASERDVEKAYMLAYESGCLGITVFREGCKAEQVLYAGTRGLEPHVAPRPRRVDGATYRAESPLGTCFITVNHDERGEPLEVFANVGKAGSDIAAVSEAIGRLISLILRLPSPLTPRQRVEDVINQLAGIGGARQLGFGRKRVRSLPDAVAGVLAEYLGMALEAPSASRSDLCPDCGEAALVSEEGCQKCHSCGYTLC